jgi:hypothetical protein
LKGAKFLFLDDLGAPDALLGTGWGRGNILPIIMTLVNAVSGTVYSRGLPAKDRIQLYGMAALFLVLLYNSPSGLVLYWTCNNIFSLGKNCYSKIKTSVPSGSIKPLANKIIMSLIIDILIFAMIYYVLKVNHGSLEKRITVSGLLFFSAAAPWFILVIKHFWKTSDANKIQTVSTKTSTISFYGAFLILWILSGIFIPSILISSSPQEFAYIDGYSSPIFFIVNSAVQAFGFFVFFPTLFFMLFSPTQKNIILAAGYAAAFSALCNFFIFTGNYGTLSKNMIFTGGINHSRLSNLLNIFTLILIFAVFFFLFYSNFVKNIYRILNGISVVLLVSIITFSCVNIYRINQEYKKLGEYIRQDQIVKDDLSPIIHLSKTGKNVVVIMLDMAESVFIPYIFEESPDLLEQYTGFVYYPNTVTFNGYTKGGAPPIFGGFEYTPEEINKRDTLSLQEKNNEALLMMPRIFSEKNWAVTVTDPPFADNNWIPNLRIYDDGISAYTTDAVYSNLWLKENNISTMPISSILKRNILWYSFFREAPLVLRSLIYANGDWCSTFEDSRLLMTLNGYSVLDYLPRLTDFENVKENTALFMVNNTTHENSFLQAPEYRIVRTVTNYGKSKFKNAMQYHVNAAAIKRLGDWLQYLKDNDVYDNTRIIFVSDHGALAETFVTHTNHPFDVDQYNCLLMCKDFYSAGILETDNTFMSNADVPVLAMKDIIENPVNPFTGKTVSDDYKKNKLHIVVGRLNDMNDRQYLLDPQKDYYVHGNIFEPANWEKAAK